MDGGHGHGYREVDVPGVPVDVGDDWLSLHAATRRFQRELVRRALERSQQNVSAAARSLQITRAHMYNLMASFGLRRQVASSQPEVRDAE